MFTPFFFLFCFFFKPWLHCTQNYKLSKRKKMQLKTIRLKKNDMWKKNLSRLRHVTKFFDYTKEQKKTNYKKKTNSNPTYFFFSLQNWIFPFPSKTEFLLTDYNTVQNNWCLVNCIVRAKRTKFIKYDRLASLFETS